MDLLNLEKTTTALRPLLHDFVTDLSLMLHGVLNRLNKTHIKLTADFDIDIPPVEGKPPQ